jgi:ADP-ribose pyrophosphatase YjhB (NUDIX family)
MNNNRPKVGVGVLVVYEGKVLLGKRKGHTAVECGRHLEDI